MSFIRNCLLSFALTLGAICSPAAMANGTLTGVEGDVSIRDAASEPRRAGLNAPVVAGNEVLSGQNSRAVVRMQDGQVFALTANSRFKIDEYRYQAAAPQEGRTFISFLQGSMRVVSGLIASKSPKNFSVRTSTATIGVRGTDFLLSVGADGQLYFQVIEGSIEVTTSAGTVTFNAGVIGIAPSGGAIATPISAGAIPVGNAVAFSQLVSLDAALVSSIIQSAGATGGVVGGTAAGVGAGLGAAALAIPLPVLAAIGAAIVAAAARGSSSTATTHGR